MYAVIMLNDDYNSMEFVIYVLQSVFKTMRMQKIMLTIHNEGKGICGVFTLDIAETKANQVVEFARINQHPLECKVQKQAISEELEISIQNAFEMAKVKKHEFLTLEHLMLELCKDNEIVALFNFYKIDVKKIKSDLELFIEKKLKDIVIKDETRPMPSAAFERVLKRAAQHVQSSGKREVKALNILVAMYSERDSFAVFFLEKQKYD